MQIANGTGDLDNYMSCKVLREICQFDNLVKQFTALNQLKDNEEVFLGFYKL